MPDPLSLPSARRRIGRPRALTSERILDAALEMGLRGLSMPALASRLGTSTATLYNYFANRDDLLRKASARAAVYPGFDDLGQDWRDLIREHARAMRRFWSAEPQLFEQYLAGTIGPELSVDNLCGMVAALERRGFVPAAGYRLTTAVNTAVLGTIARDLYLAALHSSGTSHEEAVRRELDKRSKDSLRHLRDVQDYQNDATAFDFDGLIDRVIESFADERDPQLGGQEAGMHAD